NELRNCLAQSSLNVFSLMSIENDILNDISFDIISNFYQKKVIKQHERSESFIDNENYRQKIEEIMSASTGSLNGFSHIDESIDMNDILEEKFDLPIPPRKFNKNEKKPINRVSSLHEFDKDGKSDDLITRISDNIKNAMDLYINQDETQLNEFENNNSNLHDNDTDFSVTQTESLIEESKLKNTEKMLIKVQRQNSRKSFLLEQMDATVRSLGNEIKRRSSQFKISKFEMKKEIEEKRNKIENNEKMIKQINCANNALNSNLNELEKKFNDQYHEIKNAKNKYEEINMALKSDSLLKTEFEEKYKIEKRNNELLEKQLKDYKKLKINEIDQLNETINKIQADMRILKQDYTNLKKTTTNKSNLSQKLQQESKNTIESLEKLLKSANLELEQCKNKLIEYEKKEKNIDEVVKSNSDKIKKKHFIELDNLKNELNEYHATELKNTCEKYDAILSDSKHNLMKEFEQFNKENISEMEELQLKFEEFKNETNEKEKYGEVYKNELMSLVNIEKQNRNSIISILRKMVNKYDAEFDSTSLKNSPIDQKQDDMYQSKDVLFDLYKEEINNIDFSVMSKSPNVGGLSGNEKIHSKPNLQNDLLTSIEDNIQRQKKLKGYLHQILEKKPAVFVSPLNKIHQTKPDISNYNDPKKANFRKSSLEDKQKNKKIWK
ncbi:hypothetical protein A3Q56_03494, partial [Intoshia linei]